jgi:uncharacterized damage-inducible protein DinB
MGQVPVWFERKFEFTFPVEQYPNLCARLRGTPARLEESLRGRAPEVLVRKPGGKWSAQEQAGHLLDLEPLWSARLRDFLSGGLELTVADLQNRRTHEANHNARPVNEIIAEFRNARTELLAELELIKPELFAHSLLHPRLRTPMRLVDHLFFVAEHDDHHLAHIWELVQGRGRGRMQPS